MAAETEAKPEPENFSPENARLAVTELYDALPKSRRYMYLGHLNEALVVLNDLCTKAGIKDRTKRVRTD